MHRAWLHLVATVAIIFGVPALIRTIPEGGGAPGALRLGETAFDAVPLQRLRDRQPELVIIGNSMADTNIDTALLSSLTGRSVEMLSWHDSDVVHWYLALKNLVVASGIKPRAVIVMFRGRDLLSVQMGQQGQRLFPRLAHGAEPVLERLARADCRTRHERLLEWCGEAAVAAYPLSTQASPEWLAGLADLVAPQGDLTPFDFHVQLNRQFDLGHLRAVGPPLPPDDDEVDDFARRADCTVLPAMFDEANRAHLQLVLVRVQARPLADRPMPDTRELARSLANLKAYAESRGGRLFDLTGHPALTQEIYRLDDHIAPEYMPRFTRALHERLQELW